jgi:hypothetical protein
MSQLGWEQWKQYKQYLFQARGCKICGLHKYKKPVTSERKNTCPLEGKSLSKSVVCKATVKQENKKTNTNIGLTSNQFKKRFYSHNHSFKNPDVNQTSLSNHVRKLQEEKRKHTIHYEQIDQAKSFSPVTGICDLCTKDFFLFHD